MPKLQRLPRVGTEMIGRRARITTGLYAGHEGEIVDVHPTGLSTLVGVQLDHVTPEDETLVEYVDESDVEVIRR